MWDKLQIELILSAKKLKEDSNEAILADKLQRFLQPDIKRACLAKFLDACVYKHALAFFQWREQFAPNVNKLRIAQIFQERVSALRRQQGRVEALIR